MEAVILKEAIDTQKEMAVQMARVAEIMSNNCDELKEVNRTLKDITTNGLKKSITDDIKEHQKNCASKNYYKIVVAFATGFIILVLCTIL